VTGQDFRDRLISRADSIDLALETTLVDQLEAYYQLLLTWNQRINLTGLDLESLPAQAIDRLFMEPLVAARFAERGSEVLDVGSGGGSPAIPFALAAGAHALTMVESKARKSVFLKEAIRVVGLTDSTVITARFEDIAQNLAERFDIVTIRAVKILDDDWSRLAEPLNATGSLFFLHRTHLTEPITQGLAISATRRLTAHSDLTVFKRQ
jgi:16S rRNA (guanine527-N7)-methyltransferase